MLEPWLRSIIAASVAILGFIVSLDLTASPDGAAAPGLLHVFLRLGGSLLVALASAGVVLLATRQPGAQPLPQDPVALSDSMRGRLAWMVLGIGGGAVCLIAVAVIIGLTYAAYGGAGDADLQRRYDTVVMAVFNAVLPVVATWVGTVLAFYFGNENFRQAASSTREILAGREGPQRGLTDAMVPYERIARIETTRATAEDEPMLDVINRMSEAAPRIILFDKDTQQPIYVLRCDTPPMPPGWITKDFRPGTALPAGAKVAEYLVANGAANRANAENFRYIAASASIDQAIEEMKRRNTDDLFLTANGAPGRVLGWVTGHSLRKARGAG